MTEANRIPYVAGQLPESRSRRILILAPHPDDEVFGCGGAAALCSSRGDRVQAFIVSDGGAFGQPEPGQTVQQTRMAEACQAAHVLGCQPPRFGTWPDRGIVCNEALIQDLANAVEQSGADIFLAPSPWEIHPDHQAVALAALAAFKRLGTSRTLVQYEVGATLLPNLLVDITPVNALKDQAVRCFGSQLRMQAYDRHVRALNTYRSYTLPGHVEFAEAYRVANLDEACSDPFGLSYGGNTHPVGHYLGV